MQIATKWKRNKWNDIVHSWNVVFWTIPQTFKRVGSFAIDLSKCIWLKLPLFKWGVMIGRENSVDIKIFPFGPWTRGQSWKNVKIRFLKKLCDIFSKISNLSWIAYTVSKDRCYVEKWASYVTKWPQSDQIKNDPKSPYK